MAERDLSTLKFAAEMISAVAIIISLLYVGYEIRQTQVLSQRSVDELLFARNEESNRVLIENPDFAEIFVRAPAWVTRSVGVVYAVVAAITTAGTATTTASAAAAMLIRFLMLEPSWFRTLVS